jgi:hypothetical protein
MTYQEAQEWWTKYANGRIEFEHRLRPDYTSENDRGEDDFEWGWSATGFLDTRMVFAWASTFMEAVEQIKAQLGEGKGRK